MKVGARQHRVVVQHLLEVGHEPDLVDRVAREPAADLVVDPAVGHRVEGDGDRLGDVAGEQQLQRRRRRELRRSAEPPVAHVGRFAQRVDGLGEDRLAEQVPGRLDPSDRTQLAPRPRRGRLDLLPARPPRLHHRLHHLPEARHPLPRLGREVGAAVERDPVRVEERGQRPPAVPSHPLHRLHVQRVDVGALLPVHLDRDEVLVHEGGRLRVLERLPLHHVAPVARGVADRDQDRLLLLAGQIERLRAPRVPLHGVVLVLEQVGAGLGRRACSASRLRLARRRYAPVASRANASNASR